VARSEVPTLRELVSASGAISDFHRSPKNSREIGYDRLVIRMSRCVLHARLQVLRGNEDGNLPHSGGHCVRQHRRTVNIKAHIGSHGCK
jgi:hypothetical protein